ncbi:ParB/RepB/Spo0J family partition protein [Iamia sp. SCSIO 61187]|uniref:ParB/RepB/Spo0J family partition protein n=1 Tax=Iamia sp. SCSIO 61187 TaxID=2722752 RepID=UPI001C630B8D|nr:ParB/RepB/Spo0J family partition protein [Iamia sp. SCSIO 61187]QYG95303.1 ParB/RepB/Spo0J family partition protein [Iamia sp. SCSIO 61187]
MARRSGLGRGLDSLIPGSSEPSEAPPVTGPGLTELAVGDIDPNPHQPRSHFDEESLASLAASVRELGVLQPILVRPAGERYELIAGERRWRAARRAGLSRIPAVVRTIDDSTSLEQAVVENLHRQDLNPLEEAGAYQQLIEDFGLTQDDVARKVGRSRSAVANILRLFQLPPSVQRMVRDGQLSAGHARALLGSPDRAYQEALARRCVERSLTVRDVEEAVRARQTGTTPAAKAPAEPGHTRPPGLLELEGLLSDRLDTRVSVSMGAKRGKVVIDFATVEDLERIYRILTDPTAVTPPSA